MLCCCTVGSPRIAILDAANVTTYLSRAVQDCFTRYVVLDQEELSIRLPKLFDWYKKDFGGKSTEVILWAFQFLSPQQKELLHPLTNEGYLTIEYMPYDWSPALPLLLDDVDITESGEDLPCAALPADAADSQTKLLSAESTASCSSREETSVAESEAYSTEELCEEAKSFLCDKWEDAVDEGVMGDDEDEGDADAPVSIESVPGDTSELLSSFRKF